MKDQRFKDGYAEAEKNVIEAYQQAIVEAKHAIKNKYPKEWTEFIQYELVGISIRANILCSDAAMRAKQ